MISGWKTYGKLEIETKLNFFSAVYIGFLNHRSSHVLLNIKIKLSPATHSCIVFVSYFFCGLILFIRYSKHYHNKLP